MKILVVSDIESKFIYDHFDPERFRDVKMIISCGDLSARYLSFLVTMIPCPLFYVPGNHDTTYRHAPPEGCDCIDDHIVTYTGVRILGLGGCRKYHPGPHQYTEAQMRLRIAKLRWKLRRLGGVDIVVTHAPPEGLGDADDIAHWGFAALRELIDKYQPKYLVHGHVHMSYGYNIPREIDYNGTKIINAYERYTIEIPEGQYKLKDWNQVIYKTRVKNDDFEHLVLK